MKEIKGGYLHSAAITVEGELYMWGAGQYGQLGFYFLFNFYIIFIIIFVF